jgi:hypothetical protein
MACSFYAYPIEQPLVSQDIVIYGSTIRYVYIYISLEPLASFFIFLIIGCALAQDCYKPNCSYVHYKASAEDICTKDDVSVVCARYIILVLTFYYVILIVNVNRHLMEKRLKTI